LKSALRPTFEVREAVIDRVPLFKLGCNVMLGAASELAIVKAL